MKLNYILGIESEGRESLLLDVFVYEITAHDSRLAVFYKNSVNERDSFTIDFDGIIKPDVNKFLIFLKNNDEYFAHLGNTILTKHKLNEIGVM